MISGDSSFIDPIIILLKNSFNSSFYKLDADWFMLLPIGVDYNY